VTERQGSLAGSVLVATPVITGAPFSRTVLAMIEHDAEGALGIIINVPTDLSVDRFLPETAIAVVPPAVIFIGGPVGSDSALGLLRNGVAEGIRPSPFAGVAIVDPTDTQLVDGDLRVFGGFAGWSPGQLEAEIAEGAWWSALAHIDDFFTPTPASLWSATVRRVRGRAPLYATYPDDPGAN
jgi:putative transcriptional regulator